MTGSKIIMFNLRDLLSYAKLSQKDFAKMIESNVLYAATGYRNFDQLEEEE